MPAAQNVTLQPSFDGTLAEDLHYAAIWSKLTAVGVLRKVCSEPDLLGDLINCSSRLDCVSSGPNTRKRSMFRRITSRRKLPSVGTFPAKLAPGFLTSTAELLKSGISSGLRTSPPLAIGFALIRRFPLGARAFNSRIKRPSSSKSS